MSVLYPWHVPLFDSFARLTPKPMVTIIAGPQYTGTLSLAVSCMSALFCLSPHPDAQACGHCRSCIHIREGVHEACTIIDQQQVEEGVPKEDKSAHIGVERIRQLLARFSLRSTYDSYAVVIHPAQQLTVSASNALLKCLEDPASGIHFFLVVEHLDQLLPTLRSRAQCILRTRRPVLSDMMAFLAGQSYPEPPWGWPTVLCAMAYRPLLVQHLQERGALSLMMDFFEVLLTTPVVDILMADAVMAAFDALRKKTVWSDQVLLSYCLDGLLCFALGRGHVEENASLNQSFFVMHDGQVHTVHWASACFFHLMRLKALCQYPVNSRLLIDTMVHLLIKGES